MFDPNAAAPGPIVVLQNAVVATNSSAWQEVGPHTLFTIEITGTWTPGRVRVQGYLTGTGTVTDLPVYSLGGQRLTEIRANGIYQVDVTGLSHVRTNVTWASGTSVSVSGRLSRESMRAMPRVVEIYNDVTASVAAAANVYLNPTFPVFDVTGFVYLRIGVRADATGNFTARYEPMLRNDTSGGAASYGQYEGFTDVLTQTLRGWSDLIEVKGRGARFNILNSDVGAHTFQATVLGYR